MVSKLHFYAGLFLVTACTLIAQVVQTRILSVVAWYYLAFFAISMAMFGLTAGAVFVYLRGDRFSGQTLSFDLSYFSALFAVATAGCLAVQMTLAPVVNRSVTAIGTWIELAICMALPFFFSGGESLGAVFSAGGTGATADCAGARGSGRTGGLEVMRSA